MLRVAFVGCSPAFMATLVEPTMGAGLVTRRLEEGGRPPRPPGADLVVIGPDCTDPVREAQRGFLANRALTVLLYARDQDIEGVHAQAATTPYLGKRFVVVAPDDLGAFTQAVAGAREAVRSHRALERANDFLMRARYLI